MDSDLFLTVGIVVSILSLPSILSAWSDGRAPRVGAILLVAGLGLVVVAVMRHPGGYALSEVPHVMLGVVGRLLHQ